MLYDYHFILIMVKTTVERTQVVVNRMSDFGQTASNMTVARYPSDQEISVASIEVLVCAERNHRQRHAH